MILNTQIEKPNKPERLRKQYAAIFQDRQLTTKQKQKILSLYMRVKPKPEIVVICPRCRSEMLGSKAYLTFKDYVLTYGCIQCGHTITINPLTGKILILEKNLEG